MTSLVPDDVPPAKREQIVDRLTRHYANDELTEAVFEDQLQRVYAAKTLQELDAIVSHLPAVPAPPAAPAAAKPSGRAVTPPGSEIRALFSGQERRIVTLVPRELKVRARMGYVELDLTDATFEPGVTTIEVRSFMGYVQILLPEDVRVETTGHAIFGYFAQKMAHDLEDGAATSSAVVRITGRAIFGFAESLVGLDPEDED